jgi:hypothetical protein
VKLTSAKFTLEDFPGQRSWIGKLFSTLNTFTGDVVRAFGNQITIDDNLFQEVKEVKWTNSSTDFPLKFRTKFNSAPRGLSAIYLYDHTDNIFSSQPPWIVWAYADGSVSISDIQGLTVGHNYTVRIHLIYG